MTFSTITGERDTTAQRSLWNGATPKTRWQESSWGKRIAAIAGVLVPVAITVITTVIRKKSTDTLMRKVTKKLKKAGVKK
ncbi:hypothetical protein J2S40_001186 [Nocardioides luteus]|uniref:Uncharacterized protein n=1 Tax=Nocardioides luteus TaxID=1844 RepID=A0ABQ5ST53_9ACTN|nr:hypothetical protein [Nocardioides luteus]MDR7310128.1 hypothetical protein [Nocardioides luteus]GGR64618.1 hypothetical protein GCM10010197_35040 [Nocardioides luteus]GLJ66964.1 hypothetical protein GCM10017579_10000 [Nocardioides luteus]